MRKQLIAVSVALCVGAGMTTAYGQAQQTDENYKWHAELVSFDQATKTVTVKTPILADTARDVAKFNVGDRLMLTWSGIDQYASSVRALAKYDAGQKITDLFVLPAELASKDVQNNYLTVKVRAADAKIADMKSVKPGEWITFTSRHRPADEGKAIAAVEPYVKAGTGTN
jgi:hypothetical protein